MSKKIVIGVTGEIASGKDTFVSNLIANATGKTIRRVRFSDILFETLTNWALPSTRQNLQNLAIVMDNGFGKGTLTNAVYNRIKNDKSDLIILEGIRWITDVEMLRKFEHNRLVYITADSQVRFERIKNRGEKVGESNITYEQFVQEAKAETEMQIGKIGQEADNTFINNLTLEDFQKKISEFCREIL